MGIRYAARPLVADDGDAPVSAPEMWSNTLVTFYETDPGLVESVLPRPLEPTDNPMVRLNIAYVDFGSHGGLGASVVSVTCQHEGQVGFYDLTMVMTREAAVLGGRETFGEPKKLGDVVLERHDGRVHGKVSRLGVDYMEVNGRIAEKLEPRPLSERVSFYFKFLLDPQGGGFDSDPSLVYCHRTEQQRLLERVEVILRDSNFDRTALGWSEGPQPLARRLLRGGPGPAGRRRTDHAE